MRKEPGYCLHRPTGQAYVNLAGKVHYLGKHGTPESRKAYNRLKAEWLVNRHAAKFAAGRSISGPTMAEVCLAYLDHAESYYETGNEAHNLRLALKPVSELYAKLPAANLGPLEYETIRNWWLKKPSGKKRKPGDDADPTCARQYVNSQMKRLMRVVKWAVAKGMIPASVHQTLKCIDPLKRGRVNAPEAEPIKPVELAIVEATRKHLTPVVSDMVEVQLLLGCRPGELCKLTPGMIDRKPEIWSITLKEHKTAYRGRERVIYAGPKAQTILRKYLLRGANDCLFSPMESERQRLDAKHAARVTPISCGNKPGSNVKRKPKKRPGTAFTTQSYGRSILAASKRAKVAPWSPNQLRHTRATEIRQKYGLEAASSVLGHSEITVTQVYAEADQQRAIQVAKAIG